VKKKIKQYDNKEDLWDAIHTACKNINSNEIDSLANSVDKHVILVIERKGGHVGM
jgi:hypothetical protein